MKFANLHLHSTYSDAPFTPEQLVRLGKALGYKALALTDHETDGGVKEFMEYAAKLEIDTITGTEFYGSHGGMELHLTALNFDMDDPTLRAFIKERVELYSEYTRQCFLFGVNIGVIDGFTWDDVVRFNGENTWLCIDSILNTYRYLRLKVPESFREKIFKAPETLVLKPKSPSAEQVIRVVRGADGVIALAHPNNRTHFVPELVEMGLNGIETDHPNITEETIRLAREAAETFNLYRCGGTDHTGPMGGHDGKQARPTFDGVTEEEFYILKERRLG